MSEVRRDNPETRMVDISRMIGEMWNNLDPKEKEVYELAYRKNKLKNEKEVQEYEKKYGPIPCKPRRTRK